jgi:hypothetical protein
LFETDNTIYFNKPGVVNTEKCVQTAAEYASENGIQSIVIASERGDSAFLLKEACDKFGYKGKIIVVRYHEGFSENNQQRMSDENYKKLLDMGLYVHTGTHALSSIERSFRVKWQGISTNEIVSETLRLLGRGVKTAVEIAVMAADGGQIPDIEKDIISIAGTSKGSDTALLMKPAYMNKFLQDMKIRKILCKPENF